MKMLAVQEIAIKITWMSKFKDIGESSYSWRKWNLFNHRISKTKSSIQLIIHTRFLKMPTKYHNLSKKWWFNLVSLTLYNKLIHQWSNVKTNEAKHHDENWVMGTTCLTRKRVKVIYLPLHDGCQCHDDDLICSSVS